MKKNLLLPLLSLLVIGGCTPSNTSSTSISSSTSSSTSSSVVESSSSNESSPITPVKNIVDVSVDELELVENDDGTGYLIKKYKKTYDYIRLPESYNDKPIVGMLTSSFISSSFKEIYIPDTYVDFTQSAFYSVTSIKGYYVNDTHPIYKSVDGLLYSKDETALYAFPLGIRGEYTIKEGVKVIKEGAFQTSNIETVTLPESVEVIEKSAFELAKRLRTINIPSKVTEISESCFDTCSVLKNITFSEGLTKIGYRAFWQCGNIANITFPASLKEIGESAFEGLNGVENLVFTEGLETIGDFAFAYSEYIKTITFPSTLRYIGKYAFMQNYVMKELVLTEGIETLDEGAFFYSTNLRTVTIPSTLKSIGFDCFTSSDSKFDTLIVSDDNPTFTLVDGILFSKDQKTIVFCPAKKTFENGVYTVPSGVERIEDHAFYNNSSLRKVILPTSLKEIGKAPFYVCNLHEIEYLGTMEEFLNVSTEIWYYYTGEVDDSGQVYIEIYWFILNYENGYAITEIKCSDKTLDLITMKEKEEN